MSFVSKYLIKKELFIGLGILFLIVYPQLVNEFMISISIITGIYVILLTGLGLFLGYGGQFSFAQAVFYGMGAYTSALLTTRFQVPMWLAFLFAGSLPGAVAFIIGAPILKLRGYYLAMATLSLCVIFHVVVVEQFDITGGPTGVYGIPFFSFAGYEFSSPQSYHYLVWVISLFSLIFSKNLMNSRIGRALKAIQISEEAATVLGVNVSALKIKIFALTGVTGGVAGCLFAHYVTFIAPGNFTLELSIWLVVILAIGGMRNIMGAVLGAGFTTIFPFLLGSYQRYNMLVFGVILVLILKYMPSGFVGFLEEQFVKLKQAVGEE